MRTGSASSRTDLGQAVAVRCHVTDAGQVGAAVRAATDAHGRVDVLCNVAGQGNAPVQDIDPDDFRAVPDLNLVAPLVTMQAVLPVMRRQGGGSIINVSSGITFLTHSDEALGHFQQVVDGSIDHVPEVGTMVIAVAGSASAVIAGVDGPDLQQHLSTLR